MTARERKATPCMWLPLEWSPLFASLSDGKAGMLVKALMRHAERGRTDKTDRTDDTDGAEDDAADREAGDVRDPSVRALLMVMIPQIDAGMARQQARIDASRKAIIARGQTPRGESNDSATTVQRPCNERATNVQRTCNDKTTNVSKRSPASNPPLHPLLYSTPLSPVGDRIVAQGARHTRTRLAHWIGYCIGKHYRRKRTTAWSDKELTELRKVAARPDAWSELRTIAKAYRGGYGFARRDIITLLRNWSTELDRCAAYNETRRPGDDRDDLTARYFGGH